MFCPPPSCVCCLIAEPPSPRPWDPPGSMYHLLCHLSLSPLPLPPLSLLLSCLCLLPCFTSQCRAHTLPPSWTYTAYKWPYHKIPDAHIISNTQIPIYSIFKHACPWKGIRYSGPGYVQPCVLLFSH